MDKRYQIFVSSTFSDLVEARQAVMQALLSLDHFPAGMELFPASDEDQFTLIKGVIDDSDYYVVVIAGRYGSMDAQGVSYTEKEYEYAIAQGIPVLAFLHASADEIKQKFTDQNDDARRKLEAFKAKIQSGRHVKYWKNPDELKAAVIQAIAAETKRNPRQGWVRYEESRDPRRLNQLMEELNGLRSQLAAAQTTAPPGSENYAQLTDDVEIGLWRWENGKRGDYETLTTTWAIIFMQAGPLMLDEASEDALRDHLSMELPLYMEGGESFGSKQFDLDPDSFQTIKIQLVTLGLIRKSVKRHGINDTRSYWSLTPFGETQLMKLRAKRKPKAAASGNATALGSHAENK